MVDSLNLSAFQARYDKDGPRNQPFHPAMMVKVLIYGYASRSEQRRLVPNYAGNPASEYLMFYELGVDGLFSDFADDAVAARVQFLLKTDPNYARCLVYDRCGSRRDRD